MSSGPLSGSSDPRPAVGPTESQPAGTRSFAADPVAPDGDGAGASKLALPRTLGPYRLERLLGSGGMGEVYQAYDRRLQRRVAIKHFRPGTTVGSAAASTASRQRFLREARAAAGLSHPSIVHIHDILEDEQGDWEGDWIVMERVDGPTVAQLVAQGPLPVARAITVGRQVAEALAAAHRQGVLHRDLKSENVMLGRDGRAKILDFGLAKRLWPGDTEASLSLEGRVLGTCRTMSPEQARGQELDARSDLFALGVLLYEMLTGDSPFLEDTHIDTLARVCHHHPPPVVEVNPELPEELSGLVGRLLRKERELRPAEAREVAEILMEMDATMSRSGSAERSSASPGSSSSHGAAAVRSARSDGPTRSGGPKGGWVPEMGSTLFGETLLDVPASSSSRPAAAASSSAAPSAASTGGWRWSLASLGLDSPYRPSVNRRMVIVAAVGLAAVLGLAALSLRPVMDSASEDPTVAEATPVVRPSVAVLGFKNLSGDEGVAWIATGIAEMLNAELAASPGLRTVAGETVARANRELALGEGKTLGAGTLSKVRSVLGADKVVVGSYLAVPGGDDLRLDLNVQDTVSGTTQTTLTETASRGEILGLVRRMGERVRRELGAGRLSAADTRAARATLPKSPQALELYSEGLRQMRAYEPVRARDLLRQAVEAEPGFPLAHAALAEAWSALGYDRKAQEEAARAVELAGELSREDRLFVEARDHEMSWRWDEAIESYRTLWEFFPDNVEYGLRLAAALTAAGRGREALAVVGSLRELPAPVSEDVRIDLAEAEALRWLSEDRSALQVARRAVDHGASQGARLLEAEARVLVASSALHLDAPQQASASLEAARRLFAQAGDRRGEAWTLSRLADLASLLGDLDRALGLRREALEQLREVGDQEGIAMVLNNFGTVLMSADRLDEAAPKLREALETAQKIENRRLEGGIRVTLSRLAHLRGELAESEREASRALRVAEELEFGYLTSGAQWVLGDVSLAHGDLHKARVSFEEGLERLRDQDPILSPGLLSSLGDLELVAGDLMAARKRHRDALEMRREAWSSQVAAESRLALARLALETGRPGDALQSARSELPGLSRGGREKETRAVSVVTAALVALDRADELEDQVMRLASLLTRCQTVPTRLRAGIELARGQAALGARDEALRTVESVREESQRRGFHLIEMEARLVLAELRDAAGEATATAELRALANEARDRRFLLLAHKANGGAGR